MQRYCYYQIDLMNFTFADISMHGSYQNYWIEFSISLIV
ncbi:MAG: hypothetical protein FD170_2741 [Bacteroidetes bacterium]|nr:MAG: hypothetical protein FD170_2741 [Bacteroidota bacterium]